MSSHQTLAILIFEQKLSELFGNALHLVGGILAQHRKCDVSRGRSSLFIHSTQYSMAVCILIISWFWCPKITESMATKRKVEVIVPAEESDQLLIRPLWVNESIFIHWH